MRRCWPPLARGGRGADPSSSLLGSSPIRIGALPRFGRIACGFVVSALLVMCSFMQSSTLGFSSLPRRSYRFVYLLGHRAVTQRNPLLLAGLAIAALNLVDLGFATRTLLNMHRCTAA